MLKGSHQQRIGLPTPSSPTQQQPRPQQPHSSYQTKAPLKATRTKMNGTFLLKCLAALCMLGNVTAEPGDGNGGVARNRIGAPQRRSLKP